MSTPTIPKDGYYHCKVVLSTGGEANRIVQVADGKVVTKDGHELLAEACSDFSEIGTLHYTCIFPAQAALELESLRAQVASGQGHQVAYWRNEAIREQERTERAEERVRQMDAEVDRLRQWIASLELAMINPGSTSANPEGFLVRSGEHVYIGPPPPQ
jgi:hypothetical protein